jgi:hypothetical protein
MPATISHALSMTTPDNPVYENQPKHWNSSHLATLNAVGSEISGAFANGNGISFGLSAGSVSASYTVPLTTGFAGIGFTSTTTAGVDIKATNSTNGLSMAVPAYITTQSGQAFSADASSTFQTLSFQNSNGVSFSNNAGAIRVTHALIGTATAITGGASITANSGGFSFNGTALAGTGTTFGGTNVSASMTLNSNGLQLSLSGVGGGVINQTGPNISAGTDSLWTSGTVTFGNNAYGSHITSNGSLVFKPFLGTGTSGTNVGITMDTNGLQINNTDDHFKAWSLAGNNTAGTTGTTLTTVGTLNLSGGRGITLSGNSNTIVVQAGMNTQRFQWPPGNLTVIQTFANGVFSINRMDAPCPISATRLDVPMLISIASSATANTWGFAATVIGAIYTKNGSTLNSLSSGSQSFSFSLASNTAGQTQMAGNVIRPYTIPMNVNMSIGEYYIGFGISTNTSSLGTATTALGITQSIVGGMAYIGAVGWVDEFTATSNSTTNLFGGIGTYSASISTVPPAISLSAIVQSGDRVGRAGFGAIFRNI